MIVTACDDNEKCFEQLLVMLKSLSENSPNDFVTVHLVECSQGHIDAVNEVFKGAFIKMVRCPEGVDRRGFMVCYRASAVMEAMRTEALVAWFDSDIIIRKSLDDLWSGVRAGCLKIRVRDGAPERSMFQAGVFVVGFSESTMEMVRWWSDKISGMNEWYADQLWLYRAWLKFKEFVEIQEMSVYCNNVGDSSVENPFLQESSVWHCKSSHFEHPVYQKEYQKYREMI